MGVDCHRHYHSSSCCCCSVDFDDCCCCVDFDDCCCCVDFDDCCECECLGRRLLKIALWVIGVIIVVVGIAAFVIWLVLRPTKPSFYLKDVTVRNFTLSHPDNLLSTILQVTVASHNSNGRVGIYYDRVDVFAAYRGQQITLATAVPHFYQGHDDDNVWSPYLFGDSVPVEPDLCLTLQEDEAAGILLLYVKIDARIRWKVGTWTSGRYRLEVTCPATFSFHSAASDGDPALQYRSSSGCSASV